MRERIDCFLPCDNLAVAEQTLAQLRDNKTVQHIALLVEQAFADAHEAPENTSFIVAEGLLSSATMFSMAAHTDAEYALFCMKTSPLMLGPSALERMLRAARDTDAALVYAERCLCMSHKKRLVILMNIQIFLTTSDLLLILYLH